MHGEKSAKLEAQSLFIPNTKGEKKSKKKRKKKIGTCDMLL